MRILRQFAIFLIVLQALWSGVAAVGVAAGFDEARFLCSTLSPSPAAREQMRELAALAGLSDHEPEPVYDPLDCAACSLVAVTVEAPQASLAARFGAPDRVVITTADPSVRTVRGPPVGLRAPPISV